MIKRSLLIYTLGFALSALAQENPTPAPGAETTVDKALQTELLAILEEDQQGRQQIDAVTKKHGFNSPEVRALWKSIAEKDAVNLAKIKAILDTRGWVGPEVVGKKANSTLFLVIQHSDTATQQRYLPLLRAAVKEKTAFPNQLALMEDRVALAEGRRQTYGSQLRSNPKDGHYYVSPLEDPDHVDERRAAVGLGTMAENLKRWNLPWDVAAYKAQLPELEILEWGAVPQPGGFDLPLQAKLLAISESNRKGSAEIATAEAKHGRGAPEVQTTQNSVNERNIANLAKITALLDLHGWIGPSQVGQPASNTIIYLLLSADPITRKKYLPMIRSAVQAHAADPAAFVLLEDQNALEEGRRQIYGTQFGRDEKTGQLYVRSLEDPDHVDERRASMGLGTMAEYLKLWNLNWDVEAYKKLLPTLETSTPTVSK